MYCAEVMRRGDESLMDEREEERQDAGGGSRTRLMLSEVLHNIYIGPEAIDGGQPKSASPRDASIASVFVLCIYVIVSSPSHLNLSYAKPMPNPEWLLVQESTVLYSGQLTCSVSPASSCLTLHLKPTANRGLCWSKLGSFRDLRDNEVHSIPGVAVIYTVSDGISAWSISHARGTRSDSLRKCPQFVAFLVDAR